MLAPKDTGQTMTLHTPRQQGAVQRSSMVMCSVLGKKFDFYFLEFLQINYRWNWSEFVWSSFGLKKNHKKKNHILPYLPNN